MVKKLPGVDRDTADVIAGKFAKSFSVGFLQDVEIWKNKTRIDNPLLCEEDGPLYQLRRWYEQFYVDVAEISEDMTQRFEFEVDTAHAVQAWERKWRTTSRVASRGVRGGRGQVAQMSDACCVRARQTRQRPPWWSRPDATRTAPETLADMRLYVEGGFEPVTCSRCSTQVLVKKNSAKHTSVQWTCDAAASCPHIGDRLPPVRAGSDPEMHRS